MKLDELNDAIAKYQTAWQRLIAVCYNQAFFASLRPIAVAWKMAELADMDAWFSELRGLCDQVHFAWLDERWLGTLHLKATQLAWELSVVKLYQRRPHASDALGLDHIDFLLPDGVDARAVLADEPNLHWTAENGDYAAWISLWFDGGPEAKLRVRGQTTQDAVITELVELRDTVLPVDIHSK